MAYSSNRSRVKLHGATIHFDAGAGLFEHVDFHSCSFIAVSGSRDATHDDDGMGKDISFTDCRVHPTCTFVYDGKVFATWEAWVIAMKADQAKQLRGMG